MAHDFWIRADDFHARNATAQTVRVTFEIGEVDAPEAWDVYPFKVVSLRSLGPGGLIDHQDGIVPTSDSTLGYADVALEGVGTHLIAFESNQSFSDLPVDRFNLYVEEEGLAAVAAARVSAGTTGRNGRELYSRRAKALVQIGAVRSPEVTRPIGQTLEIVPLKNPHSLSADEPLTVQVLFRGRPLSGATAHISALGPQPQKRVAATLTNASGEATFSFPKTGDWNVVVIWSDPLGDTDRAEFETIFSSLTFGY